MVDRFEERKLNVLGWSLHAAGLAITVGIVLGVHQLVFLSMRAEGARLEKAIHEASDYLERANQIHQQHADLEAALLTREERVQELNKRVPGQPRESEFLAQLTQLARTSGMSINGYDPGMEEQDGASAAIKVQLKGTASFGGICRFLNGLDQLPRLCRLTDLSVVVSDPHQEIYPVDLTLRIFFFSNQLHTHVDPRNG